MAIEKRKQNLLALVESALMVALAFVLSFVKIWEMPLGGSITLLSMLPIMIVSFRHGVKWGLGAGFVYSWTQILTGGVFGWGLTPTILIGSLLLDYIIAFTGLGLAGIARSKGKIGIILGAVGACVLRFLSSFVSGVVLFAQVDEFVVFGQTWVDRPVLYSLCYNGMYMLPETIFTVAAVVILLSIPDTKKLLFGEAK